MAENLKMTYKQRDSLCEHYLRQIYDGIRQTDSYIPSSDYGELLFEGVTSFLTKIKLTDQDVFVDFGSGRGKLVNQVFLQTDIQQAYGIELLAPLYQQAVLASKTIRADLPEFFIRDRKLGFFHANFLNYPLMPLTIGFINATCFPPLLINSLGTLLNEITTLHTVLSLRPIPSLISFKFKSAFKVECSWDSTLCYLYQRLTTLSN